MLSCILLQFPTTRSIKLHGCGRSPSAILRTRAGATPFFPSFNEKEHHDVVLRRGGPSWPVAEEGSANLTMICTQQTTD